MMEEMPTELGLESGGKDVVFLYNGEALAVHGPKFCEGDTCCIHNPTDHHMRTWPQIWRGDAGFIERMCPHGVGHPDPDDYKVRHFPGYSVHGCDGCCVKNR